MSKKSTDEDIFNAVKKGSSNLIKKAIANGADINAKQTSSDRYAPLHITAREGKLNMVKFLIEQGAKVDIKSKKGSTPFNEALYFNHLDCAALLLEKGADINNHYKDLYGEDLTSLKFAIGGGREYSKDLVTFLLEHGAALDEMDTEGDVVLHYAARMNTINLKLIKYIKDINTTDREGKTALHHAALHNSPKSLKSLLKSKKIDVNYKDNNGRPPLYYSENENIAALLIKAGADFDPGLPYDKQFIELYCRQHINIDRLKSMLGDETDEPFNINKMLEYIKKAVLDFSKSHKNETFYAFAIDAGMLCLNSLESFEKTLQYYQQEYPVDYSSQKNIKELKFSTGDWDYQGFASLSSGFSDAHYNEHYNMSYEEQKKSDYTKAMKQLIRELKSNNVFDVLKTTKDFKVIIAEHTY